MEAKYEPLKYSERQYILCDVTDAINLMIMRLQIPRQET